LTGTLPPADRRVKRDLATPGAWALGRDAPGRPRSRYAITGSEAGRSSRRGFVASSAERFGGPRARRVSHQAVGRVGRRAEAGRCGGEAQVGEASSRAQPSGSAGRPPAARSRRSRSSCPRNADRPAESLRRPCGSGAPVSPEPLGLSSGRRLDAGTFGGPPMAPDRWPRGPASPRGWSRGARVACGSRASTCLRAPHRQDWSTSHRRAWFSREDRGCGRSPRRGSPMSAVPACL